MAVTQYIGSRYVPLFADPIEWSASNTYEPLTIVIHEGNSYTSKQAVPKGIDIANEAFWALTGNYNAQVELYRRETAAAKATADDAQADATAAQTDIDTLLPKSDFSAENTIKRYIDRNKSRVLSFDTATDMQAAAGLEAGMTCHTNGFTTVGDGGAAYYTISANGPASGRDVLACVNELYATLVYEIPSKIYDSNTLANALSDTTQYIYDGKVFDSLSTIDLTSYNEATLKKKVFKNCVFNLNVPLFTHSSAYKRLPSFVDCVFIGSNDSNSFVVTGSDVYIAKISFANCTFIDCGLVDDGSFVQGVVFTNCQFIGTTDLITSQGFSGVYFSECMFDNDFDARIINAVPADTNINVQQICLKNCVIEGNSVEPFYMEHGGELHFDTCYFEDDRSGLATFKPFSERAQLLILTMKNCKVSLNLTNRAFVEIDNAYTAGGSVNTSTRNMIHIEGCKFSRQSSNTTEQQLLSRYDLPNTRIQDCIWGIGTLAGTFGFYDTVTFNAQNATSMWEKNTISIRHLGNFMIGWLQTNTLNFEILVCNVFNNTVRIANLTSETVYTGTYDSTTETVTLDVTDGSVAYPGSSSTHFVTPLQSLLAYVGKAELYQA